MNLHEVNTPVDPDALLNMCVETGYDKDETRFLVDGFRNGFDIHYNGSTSRQDTSHNIPLKVGSKTELWNKIIKEVRLKRVAGPFSRPPFKHYIQSPVGLVPKAGGQTRLIFHLSYNFGQEGESSVNAHTPEDLCKVKYLDLDHAVFTSLEWGNHAKMLKYVKTDVKSAFRLLPLLPRVISLLLFKAENPTDGKYYWFCEKNLPFGHSISCCHFQRFSDCIRHIVETRTNRPVSITNYLDDFLFVGRSSRECNRSVTCFIDTCRQLGVPLALEKTEWATDIIIFLGIVLNGTTFTLGIPEDKRIRALNMLQYFSGKAKATVHELQQLAGFLNFLTKAIFSGRAFTRGIYARFGGILDADGKSTGMLKKYHHVRLNKEFKKDCLVWQTFLNEHYINSVCRPYVDLYGLESAEDLKFYSDASKSIGLGAWYDRDWVWTKWEPDFISQENPSIQFLELYAVCVGIFLWSEKLRNRRIVVFCDNDPVKNMINNLYSGCSKCMNLLRMLVFRSLQFNFRVFCRHIFGHKNHIADALSRADFKRFEELRLKHNLKKKPQLMPTELWPLSHLWRNESFLY